MALYRIAFYSVLLPIIYAVNKLDYRITYLEPGDIVHYEPIKPGISFYESKLEIYCYRGSNKTLGGFFHTALMQLEIDNEDYSQYEGPTPEAVKENYDEQNSIFHLNVLSYNKRSRKILNPFNQTCVGIESTQPYNVKLVSIRLDFYKIILFFVGLFTFWYSAQLSNNSIFYYISGILIGIFASFLVLVYLISKLFPRRPFMYGVLIGGSTITLYILQMIWDNIQMILKTHQAFVFWYIIITGLLSFVICYRYGPPTNERSKNLIKWGLQLAGLVMIFWSSEYEDATSAVIFSALIAYYFPRQWLNKLRALYLRKFPPKPRLLSNEEYYEQGVRETSKALDHLRKYCNSPECQQWRIVTKLKDPQKFASFMEGSSHILDEEILEYETSRNEITDSELSEDENDNGQNAQFVDNNEDDDISEDDEEENNYQQSYQNRSSNLRKTLLPGNGTVTSNTTHRNYSYSRTTTTPRKVIYRSYGQEYSDED